MGRSGKIAKLSGFTVLELLIAMALTGMALLLGYGVLRLTGVSLQKLSLQQSNAWESQLLWNQLEDQLQQTDSLEISQAGITFFLDSDTLSEYRMEPGKVIQKRSGRLDTFQVSGEIVRGNVGIGWADSLLMDTLWIRTWPAASLIESP